MYKGASSSPNLFIYMMEPHIWEKWDKLAEEKQWGIPTPTIILAILTSADDHMMFATSTTILAEMRDTRRELTRGTTSKIDEHDEDKC